jgi:hypothetical protein
MTNEKRKSARQHFERTCWIRLAPDRILEASIVDISHSGARIMLRQIVELPDQFELLVTRDGKVGRKANVAWTSDSEIGLRFVSRTVLRIPDAAESGLPEETTVKV